MDERNDKWLKDLDNKTIVLGHYTNDQIYEDVIYLCVIPTKEQILANVKSRQLQFNQGLSKHKSSLRNSTKIKKKRNRAIKTHNSRTNIEPPYFLSFKEAIDLCIDAYESN